MKKNLQEPKQVPKNPEEMSNKYYKVFYSKDVNKKKKTFSEGVITWQNKKIKLYNADGQVLIQMNQKNQPQVNEEYVVGYKYAVLIDSEFDKEAFTSGRVFIALVDGTMDPLPSASTTNAVKQPAKPQEKKPLKDKPGKQQTKLVSSTPVKTNPNNKETTELENGLVIENIIFSKLREHQIEGVQFMYNCLMGYKSPSICGCILADFMGLGKTLQTITLIYSLLKMRKISKCIVISPLTLVYVWQKQCKKWLDSKLNPLIALGDGQEVKNICKQFANNQYRMLVLSYEGFYRFIDILDKKCDLIVFDEGHRLKNKNSKVYKKILNFSCRKRVLLTGTPLQNNLQELYTCISIVNPSMFPSEQLFNNVFQKPILNGMAKKATQIQRKIAIERTIQLANKIKEFSLRRKADTLEKYLPIKRQYFVLFKLTSLQKLWYERLLKRKETESDVLGFLNLFRKLFTHPQILKNDRLDRADSDDFIEQSMEEVSYKMNFVLDVCLKAVEKDEKVIVVSYFTSTLDFIGKILKDNDISFVKLDGKVDGKDRQVVVNSFEKQKNVLLLSGKAGGTGLTLVTARTMVILQPDWNPSNDSQVIGRIWRQGQTQQVSIYRLVIISSFEQRIIQRQQLKNALSQKLIDQNKSTSSGYDFMDMKKLFVQSSEKSIFFKESENVLDKVYAGSGLSWEGVMMVACKMSHGGEKGEEGSGGEKKKELKMVEKNDDGNEFADGMLLFEGLIGDGEEEKQPDEKLNQGDEIYGEQTESYKLPVKIKQEKQKKSSEIVLQKQIDPNHPLSKSSKKEATKSTQKQKRLKKYDIVEMDEYKRYQGADSDSKKQQTFYEEETKLQEDNELPQEVEQQSKEIEQRNRKITRKQLFVTEASSEETINNKLNSTISNSVVSSEQTVSVTVNSQQQTENNSKKGHSLVLNKLKLKKKPMPQQKEEEKEK